MTKEETIGRVGERLFEDKCKELNLKFKSQYKNISHDFDFLVNDLKIEVKTSNISPYSQKVNWGIDFECRKNTKDSFDILVGIILVEKPIFYIIPRKNIKSNKGIAFNPNKKQTVNTRYYSNFIDAWNNFTYAH